MSRLIGLLICLSLTGCSTAPCADFLDWFSPGRLPANPGQPIGGVCRPQGILPGGGTSPNLPPPPNSSVLDNPFPIGPPTQNPPTPQPVPIAPGPGNNNLPPPPTTLPATPTAPVAFPKASDGIFGKQ